MKEKSKVLLIKISIPIFIIGGVLGIEKFLNKKTENPTKDTVVVCEDNASLPQVDEKPLEVISKKSYGNIEGLSANIGFFSDDEAVVGIGIGNEAFYNKYIKEGKELSTKKSQEAWNDIEGNIYKLNLISLDKKPLNIETMKVRQNTKSGTGKIYYWNNIYSECIYDLNNDTSIVARPSYSAKERDIEEWSEDGNCWICYRKGALSTYNYKDKSTKNVKIKRDDLSISEFPCLFSEDGKIIYFSAHQSKDEKLTRQGIFRIHMESGKIEEVLMLPYVEKSSKVPLSCYLDEGWKSYYVLNGGKKVIFRGTINKKRGLHIYDRNSQKFYCVVPDPEKLPSGLYSWGLWISPDNTKIIYNNVIIENGKQVWNLYGAKINGNNLASRVCLYKDIKLSDGWGFNKVQWSADSKKILFFDVKNQIKVKNVRGDETSYNAQNEVNIITFK